MTALTTESSLAEIVTARPSLARALEARGLEYCCGGATTLDDACAALHLDANAVLAELTAGTGDEPTPDWATMNVADLVDHLESTHHQYQRTAQTAERRVRRSKRTGRTDACDLARPPNPR